MQKKFISFPSSSCHTNSLLFPLPLTCPCALVTSWPVTPCRLERVLPKACELAMEPMAAAAAAAAAWLASGLLTSCKERKDQGETTTHRHSTTENTFTLGRKFSLQMAHAKVREPSEGAWGMFPLKLQSLGEVGNEAGREILSINWTAWWSQSLGGAPGGREVGPRGEFGL